MKVVLMNDFHNTQSTVYIKNDKVSKYQLNKISKELCGIDGCTCGTIGGNQENNYENYINAIYRY